MNINETRRMASRICGLVCIVSAAFAQGALGAVEIDHTVEVPADGLVLVENLAGRIEISTWDRAEVQVKGKAGDDVEEVEVKPTSNGVHVKVINRKNTRTVDGTKLYLRVPEKASIEAEGVSTDIFIKGIKGETVSLETVSGDLEIDAEVTRADLNSVSGDISFRGGASRLTAEAVSGDLTLIGVRGEVKASTVSGDLSMEAEQVSRAGFETVSGDMSLELALTGEGRLTCDSMSGDVKLLLPADQQASFTAQSYSGSIHSDFGSVVSVSKGPGSSLNHQVENSTAKIRLETFSGDVSIRSR